MAKEIANEGDAPDLARRIRPDPHGQAALLLVESLIHTLIGRAVLSVEEAVEIVKTAVDVEKEIDAELAEVRDLRPASTLLKAIESSLMQDLPLSFAGPLGSAQQP